jgi:hypothetical protein
MGWSRQIWDVYEDENPGVKVELFTENEGTIEAFRAKVAGGYTPAFGPVWLFVNAVNSDNADQFVDLTTVEGIPWDKYTHDPLNSVPALVGVAPRSLSPFQGFIWGWAFHADLMEQAGLDPRKDVKTNDDLKDFLQAGTEWANATDGIDYFWDTGYDVWGFGSQFMQVVSFAFADGQPEDMIAAWKGEKPISGPDSPFRHFFEVYKEAYDAGWIPESFWTRQWETDMESSYISKKSVLVLHGPWVWDKAVAADPTVQQLGFPASPPAEGQDTWKQFIYQPDYVGGFTIPIQAQSLPEWPAIAKAFVWWNSEEAIAMRSEAMGQAPAFEGLEVEFDTPQWNGLTKEIATPGGLWENVQYVDRWLELEMVANRKPGSPGILDWESGAMTEKLSAVMTGDLTVAAALDWCQANRDASFEA